MKLFIHSHTSKAAPLWFGNGLMSLSHMLPAMWLLIRDEIKVNRYYEMRQRIETIRVKTVYVFNNQ